MIEYYDKNVKDYPNVYLNSDRCIIPTRNHC